MKGSVNRPTVMPLQMVTLTKGFGITALVLFSLSLLRPGNQIQPVVDRATDFWLAESNDKAESRDNLLDVKNETLGFSKIFVLNMPDRMDRMDVWSLASLHTNISFEYIDGVKGSEISDNAAPVNWPYDRETPATLGCFRGHMNAVQRIVNERLSSAIIFESDADWDVMLKSQLVEFARGSRYLQGSDGVNTYSPYGDDWDILWLGHCGAKNRPGEDGRYYVVPNDPTVVPPTHLAVKPRRRPDLSPPAIGGQGNFTRLVYAPSEGLCAFGYAMSLRGAEKMLLNWSLKPQATVWDAAISTFCTTPLSNAKCYTPWPALFESYKAPGNRSKDSDRVAVGGFRQDPFTHNLVFPMRPNLERLVMREPTAKSQWPRESMLQEIDLINFAMPQGHGEFVRKEDFVV